MWPSATSASRSSRKFSTIPLRTTATSSSAQPVSGWAFSNETFPCVAQRVWPTPVVAASRSVPAASFSWSRLPTART